MRRLLWHLTTGPRWLLTSTGLQRLFCLNENPKQRRTHDLNLTICPCFLTDRRSEHLNL